MVISVEGFVFNKDEILEVRFFELKEEVLGKVNFRKEWVPRVILDLINQKFSGVLYTLR